MLQDGEKERLGLCVGSDAIAQLETVSWIAGAQVKVKQSQLSVCECHTITTDQSRALSPVHAQYTTGTLKFDYTAPRVKVKGQGYSSSMRMLS